MLQQIRNQPLQVMQNAFNPNVWGYTKVTQISLDHALQRRNAHKSLVCSGSLKPPIYMSVIPGSCFDLLHKWLTCWRMLCIEARFLDT
jgi:hypothetical protein